MSSNVECMSGNSHDGNGDAKSTSVYRRGLQWLELVYGLLLCFYSYILTGEGCGYAINLCSYPGVQLSSWHIRIYATLIVLIFTVAIGLTRNANNKYVKELEEKCAGLVKLREIARRFRTVHDNLHLIFLRHLESIGETLKFSRSERISLYILDENNQKFIQIARHSKNPDYKRSGRMVYPIDEGLIARTLVEDDMVYDASIPSYKDDSAQYIKYMVDNYKMKEEVVRKLTMHPRFMAGLRISSSDGNDWRAVLIVESDKKKRWQKGDLKAILARNKLCMYKLICDFPDSVSSIPAAQKEGL